MKSKVLPDKSLNWKSRLKTSVFFVLFAIPGVLIFTFSSIFMLMSIFKVDKDLPNPIKLGLLCIVSMVWMLIGLGKWGQWRYFLVFLSIPVVFGLSGILIVSMEGGKEAMLLLPLFAGPTLFLISRRVHDYYAKAEDSKKGRAELEISSELVEYKK